MAGSKLPKRTYVLAVGPLTLNFHTYDRRASFRFRAFKRAGWCWFFGVGSIAYWRHQRGLQMKVLANG